MGGASRVSVVIGAGYGDEGKGLVTDYLSDHDTLVVRHNGGYQAGHTVVTPEGQRHVFKHFGSGTLRGARTYLSRYFVANPMFYVTECEELQALGYNPNVYLDENCVIATPYDLMLNHGAEKARGKKKHGSCGMGINEAVQRHECSPGFKITAKDLTKGRYELQMKLDWILDKYILSRAEELGIPSDGLPYLKDARVRARFLEECDQMMEHVVDVKPALSGWAGPVVFEGAQGLMLDQGHKNYPHVTRSRTGLYNAVELVHYASMEGMADIYYVTRCYATRHGAGPLPHELPSKPYSGIEDRTNVENGFQDALRFGHIDVDELTSAICRDIANCSLKLSRLRVHLVVTCVDQLDPGMDVTYYYRGEKCTSFIKTFYDLVANLVGAESVLLSRGPTRETLATMK
jgi:adenylosuccinate synthase